MTTGGDSSPVVEDVEMAVSGEEKVGFLVFKSDFVRRFL
jgi:hypothetical protein